MNILIPFDTPNTQALTQALRIVARGEFICITDFDEVFPGKDTALCHAAHDIVLVDLDASNLHAEDAMTVTLGVKTTMERLKQLMEHHLFKLANERYTFVFFSKALVNGLASAESESFNPLQAFLEEMALSAANQELLQPEDDLGLLVPAPWNVIDMARSLALKASDLAVTYATLKQKEIPVMSATSPRLTAAAKAKLNDLLPSSDGLRFACASQLTVYTYSNAPGELRQRLNLLAMPIAEFFEPNFNGPWDILNVLESFVLRCGNKESRPGDVFEATFAKFLEIYTPELFKAPEDAPALDQSFKPNTYSRWNSSECNSGLTNAMRLTPLAAAAGATRPVNAGRLSAPEDVNAIRLKYAALMAHIEHVKHWIGLFTHLSAEDQASKESIFKEVAAPHQLAGTINVTLKFSVQNLFTDQFLAAKQDGAYLGVVLSVSPQTELEFVNICCGFKFD